MGLCLSRTSTAGIPHNLVEKRSLEVAQYSPHSCDRRSSSCTYFDCGERRGSNQFLYDLLDRLNSNGVSLETLIDLKALLEKKLFALTSQSAKLTGLDLSNQRVASIAVRLSEPLAICHDKEVSIFIETQLRALIAAFAILHFQGTTRLSSDVYDDLKFKRLGSLYSTVCQQKKECGSPQTATNVYLIQLALQYLSLFGCFRNREYESGKPVVDIVFSTLMIPAQQYQNSITIVTGIQQLARIWKKREPKRHPICDVQEQVRRATEALKTHVQLGDASVPVDRIIHEILEQLEQMFQNEVDRNPDKLDGWHFTRNALQLGAPEINSRYWFYALLDCIAQLSSLLSLKKERSALHQNLESFVLTTNIPEFRWKAMEILLSYKPSRPETMAELIRMVRSHWILDSRRRDEVNKDIEIVMSTLEAGEAISIRRRLSEPCANDHTQFHRTLIHQTSASHPNLTKVSTSISEGSGTEHSDVTFENPWRENVIGMFKPMAMLPDFDVSSDLKISGGKDWRGVGLSSDAQRVFFLSEKMIYVFGSSPQMKTPPFIFRMDKKDPSCVKMAAVTENFLVLVKVYKSTNTILVKQLGNETTVLEYLLIGSQIKAAIARESSQYLDVLIAQGNGRILVYRLDKTQQPWQAAAPSSELQVTGGDFVKHMSIGPNHDCIAALTHRNILLVWSTGPNITKKVDPVPYSHGYYNPDPGDYFGQSKGLTSASVYCPSESTNTYTFCTSFPTRTRCNSQGNWDTKGEWSYITPNLPSPSSPGSDLRENLTQFSNYGGLTLGAVSSTANIFAVLEKYKGEKRRVLWMPIQKGEPGGVRCPDQQPFVLDFSLQGKDQSDEVGRGSCALAFRDRSGVGTCLVAADIKGRVWQVPFEAV